MQFKLTTVSINTWGRRRTWFVNLPVINGKTVLTTDIYLDLLRDFDLPRGTTISIS